MQPKYIFFKKNILKVPHENEGEIICFPGGVNIEEREERVLKRGGQRKGDSRRE
jgi:hypothetical protein